MGYKYLKSLFFFAIAFFSNAQETIDVLKVHKNTIKNMQGLIDLAIQKSGFTKDNQIFLNRYMNYSSDWNGDGLIDLVIPVGGDPEVGSFATLLIQKKIMESYLLSMMKIIQFLLKEMLHKFIEVFQILMVMGW